MGTERVQREPTFADAVTAELGGPRTGALLEKLASGAPWDELAEPIRPLYQHGEQGGRPFSNSPGDRVMTRRHHFH